MRQLLAFAQPARANQRGLAAVAQQQRAVPAVVELFVGDESPPVIEFVFVDGGGEFGDFRPAAGRRDKLSAFGAAVTGAGCGAAPIDKGARVLFCDHLHYHTSAEVRNIDKSRSHSPLRQILAGNSRKIRVRG